MQKTNLSAYINAAFNKYKKGVSVAFFCAIMFLVVLNAFTPLRLNVDSIRYLNILQYLKGGLDKESAAAKDFLPHGYPWILFLFDKLNLLNSFSITIINISSVFFSSYLLTNILSIKNKLLFFSLVLLSFVNIKHLTLPLADCVFVALFVSAIYLWSKFFNGKRHYIFYALLITAISIYVRTAGVALIPGILFYLLNRKKEGLRNHKILVVCAILILLATIIVFLVNLSFFEVRVSYLKQLNLMQVIKNPYSIVERLLMHFKEIGETILNIPYSKLTDVIKISSFDTAEYLLYAIGALSVCLFLKAAIRLKLFGQYVFWTFLSYLAMIFLWPFYDTRFLMPLIPIFIYLFFTCLLRFFKSHCIKFIPLSVYMLLGLASLFYSDALSLNKSFFLNHYGFDQQLTNAYRIHFNNEKSGKTPGYNINTDNVLYLLEKYDRKP